MEEKKESKKNDWLILALIGCSVVSIFASFYFYYYKKDFTFIVEVPCDAATEVCFQRDCSNPDDCPPNGLSDFKRYGLNAYDFKMCENEDCTHACENKNIICEKMECVEDLDVGESCSH